MLLCDSGLGFYAVTGVGQWTGEKCWALGTHLSLGTWTVSLTDPNWPEPGSSLGQVLY